MTVAVLAMWVASAALVPSASVGGVAVGAPAPTFAGPTTQGAPFRLQDQQGKVVLVNFWATWCGPCQMEIPELISLQKRYADRGFTVVGVSLDQAQAPQLRPFVQKAGVNYPVLVAPEGMQAAYGGVPAIPMTFLLDRKGVVVDVTEGLVTAADLESKIERLL